MELLSTLWKPYWPCLYYQRKSFISPVRHQALKTFTKKRTRIKKKFHENRNAVNTQNRLRNEQKFSPERHRKKEEEKARTTQIQISFIFGKLSNNILFVVFALTFYYIIGEIVGFCHGNKTNVFHSSSSSSLLAHRTTASYPILPCHGPFSSTIAIKFNLLNRQLSSCFDRKQKQL